MSSLHVTWLACTVGALVCLPFAGGLADEIADAPASSIWWLIYLGVFPTAIAFTTYGYALKHMTASSLGVTTYLVPGITIVMSLVLLNEMPPQAAYLGGVLALVGVAVARRKPQRSAAPNRSECKSQPMGVVANILVGLVAALHPYFLVLEMFLWTTPAARPTSDRHRVRRGDQGARSQPGALQRLPRRRPGLRPGRRRGRTSKVFFLACVIVAGVFGGATVSRQILVVQALPALSRSPPSFSPPAESSPLASSAASSHPRKASRLWVGSPRS